MAFGIFNKDKANPDSTKKVEETNKSEEKKDNVAEPKITVEIQAMRGSFGKDDFKELVKLSFKSANVDEMILVGEALIAEGEKNKIAKLILEEVDVKISEGFSANYILKVVDGGVTTILVVISDSTDDTLKEMLTQNKQIIRISNNK